MQFTAKFVQNAFICSRAWLGHDCRLSWKCAVDKAIGLPFTIVGNVTPQVVNIDAGAGER